MDLSYDKCQFEVVSGKVMISDPCYKPETWCQGSVEAANGQWFPGTQIVNLGGWGHRVVELHAHHEDFCRDSFKREMGELPPAEWEHLPIDVGVDSGQCGIFDFSHYRDDKVVEGAYRLTKSSIGADDEWYGLCCDRTLSFYKWGIIPYGVVSSSGCGDGSYDAYAVKNAAGDAIAIKIVFIRVEVLEEPFLVIEDRVRFQEEDSGSALIATLTEPKDAEEGMFVRLQSWDEKGGHAGVREKLNGKKIRIVAETIYEPEKDVEE